MDTEKRTKKELIQDNIQMIISKLHPFDPVLQMQYRELFDAVHNVEIAINAYGRYKKFVRYPNNTARNNGWGEQNYIYHWWIGRKQPGLITSACGINSTKDWVQWVVHYPALARCKICQDLEILELAAIQKKLARHINKGDA